MESTAFFERKIALTPRDLNLVNERNGIDELILKKLRETLQEKCSEHGYVLPGVKLLSRSMGAFEAARFTGDAVYFVKAEGRVIYPVDGLRVEGQVIRKNKLGLLVNYKDALRVQIPRDLHLGNDTFESVNLGDVVEVELKKSIFQINDPYILTNGLFVRKVGGDAMVKLVEAAEEGVGAGAGTAAVEETTATAPVAAPVAVPAVVATKEGGEEGGKEEGETSEEEGEEVVAPAASAEAIAAQAAAAMEAAAAVGEEEE